MRSLHLLFRSARRSVVALAALLGLVAASVSIAGISFVYAADPPTDCGSAGTAPWPSFVFNSFVSGRYVDVTTFNGTNIDAIPEVQGSSTAGGTFTSNGTLASLEITGTSGQLDVIWKFVETGTTNPVPVLASWTIGDIDSVENDPSNYIEAVRVSTDDLFGYQLNNPTAIVPDTGTPGVILFPGGDNNTDSPTPGDSTRDTAKVQLDFAGTSEAAVTYLAISTGRIFSHKGDGPDMSAPQCTGVADHDNDGLADLDDPDDDNDGISDIVEGDGDTDSDGVPDYKDLDSDSDGISDDTEDGASNGAADFDGDGTPNYLDLDSDGDKIFDADEAGHGITATAGVIPGPVGANGWADAADTSDDETDGTLVTEDYILQNNDGGTVDFLENADTELVSISSPSVVPGTQATVTLSIRNNGVGDSGDVTISYPQPANTTLNVAGSPGCSFNSPNIECAITGPIADGATPTATITLDTSPSAAAGVENITANLVFTSTPDANGANNSANGTFTFLDPIADVEVTAVSSPSITPGAGGTVNVDYRNNGPSDAQAFNVTYELPADTSFVPAGSTAGCVLNGTSDGVVCPIAGPTSPGFASTVAINVAVASNATAGTTNVQGAVENQAVTDDDATNDTFAATFTVSGPVADIEVSATTPSITPGETGSVTISIDYESGPSTATGSEIVYVLPPGVTVSGALPSGCAESPVGTVTCGPVDISSGSVPYVIGVLVSASAPPSATLDGTVTGSTTASDPDGASGDADITTNAAQADISVVVTDPAAPLTPGTTGVVNVTVSNGGPSDAAGTSVTYVLPTGVEVDTSTSLPGGCTEGPTGTVVCTVGTVTTSTPVSLNIPVLMPANASETTIFSDGTVDATTAATDPTPANNTNINSTVQSGPASADLSITVDSVPTLQPGATGQIDATVTNNGPSDAGSVEVTYSLPAGVIFDTAAPNPSGCSETAGVITCPVPGPIVEGAPVAVVIPVEMLREQPSSGPIPSSDVQLTNQGVSDPAAPNDVASATITLDVSGDSDGDGIPDGDEIDPDGTGSPIDTDSDGVPDYLDIDADNDGILDADETDGGDVTIDTDGDGLPDYRDLDSDNDGIPDVHEGGNGDLDADDDGMIDSMLDPSTGDTNDDGLADAADTSPVNTDGAGPEDYRDLDADDDGVLDVVEGGNAELDLNDDGTIDAMDDPSTGDTNNDGLADTASTVPPNTDGLGAPDYQDLDSDEDGVDDVDEGGNGALDGDDDGVIDNVDANDANGDGVHDGISSPDDTDNDGIPNVSDADSDGDGITDLVEGSGDADGDGIPNYLDLDSDNDGIPDVVEGGNGALDADGNGVIDNQAALDTNGDGLADNASQTHPNTDGDGPPDYLDLDSDNDGLTDVLESGNGPLDVDGNGTIDAMDDPSTGDTNDDGLADVADTSPTDTDGDGTPDFQEVDSDNDGILDSIEAGADPSDPDDTDNDGTPDFQEVDSDNDGIPDAVEAGPNPATPLDTDGDSIADYQEVDSDNDGIPDAVEAGPNPATPLDTDNDGTPDYRDLDSDNDGLPDSVEAGSDPTNPVDADGNGIPDYRDLDTDGDGIPDAIECSTPTCPDTDGDGKPDHKDLDSDGDGIPDAVEAGPDGTTPIDTDKDGKPDYKDTDSDNDGIPDALEAGTKPKTPVDTDKDGIPDYRDPDSDNDGFGDGDEFNESDPTADADKDGILDFQDPDVTRILGIVRDADGNPLGGITITITDAAGKVFTLITQADGSYELVSTADAVVTPGVATVTAVLANGVTITDTVTVVGGISVERDLQGVAVAAPPLAFTGAPTLRMIMMTFPLFATGIVLLLLAARLRKEDDITLPF